MMTVKKVIPMEEERRRPETWKNKSMTAIRARGLVDYEGND